MATPPLGFLKVEDRTPDEEAAHDAACAGHVMFALQAKPMAKGERVALYDFWKHPDVIADVGFKFERIHQITGSCVWAGGTNAVFSTIAAQRVASDAPTRAFLPFTLHNYAMSRHYIAKMSGKPNWDAKGEGSMGSTFAQSLREDGIRDWVSDPAMPSYTDTDGVSVTKNDELLWSSYKFAPLAPILSVAKEHLFGSTAECKTTDDITAMVQNGYGVSFACDNFIGHASVVGSGADACVVGRWDSSGGHQQSIHAVWEHPNLGRLFWAQNNWPGETYPTDPAGGPECGCWVTEKNVQAAMRLHAEVYGLSHLAWFPANDKIMEWSGI